MAETLEAGGGKTTNLTADRKALEKYFAELDKLHAKFETASGELRSDLKEVYEKAAEKTGMTRKVLRHEYARRRAHNKRLKVEAGFEESEKEDLDRIRAALGDLADTPLGMAAQGDGDDETEH